MPQDFLPYGRQDIDDDDVAAVVAALKSDHLTTGPAVTAFECDFAAKVGAAHAVSCTNATAALHLAAMALDLGPGTAAVVPAITFLATANAVRMTGADVVFADVDPDTGLITPETLERALAATDKAVKAVLPVHLAGQTADMAGIAAVAARHNLVVVEDACHAVGATDAAGRPVGACPHGGMAVFSFHPVKTLTSGEGGMLTTGNAAFAERAAKLRSHGMTRDPAEFIETGQAFAASGAANPWYYEMAELGWNYRLTDIQAALGRSQLAKLPHVVARREHLWRLYEQLLAPLAPRVRMMHRAGHGSPAWHLAVALIDFAPLDRATVMNRLREAGIGTQVHYLPVNRQPYYRRLGAPDLPGADCYYGRCLSLPLFPAMADGDVHRVVHALANALAA